MGPKLLKNSTSETEWHNKLWTPCHTLHVYNPGQESNAEPSALRKLSQKNKRLWLSKSSKKITMPSHFRVKDWLTGIGSGRLCKEASGNHASGVVMLEFGVRRAVLGSLICSARR